MPKRISRPKRGPKEVNRAFRVVQLSTEAPEADLEINTSLVSKIMSEMGKKGGKIGGKRRLDTMTSEQRSQVALKAAQARWKRAKSANS